MSGRHVAELVVVGGGQAAAQFIEALRCGGYPGGITLIGEEPHVPYQRPPLSKQYLAGACDARWLDYRPPDFYAAHHVVTRFGCRVVEIDRAAKHVRTSDGARLPYERLALMTGARARRLSAVGETLPGVHYLRTLADADQLKADLADARRVVIVGGGFIGLEVAAVLAGRGHAVALLESAATLLPRVVSPEISAFLSARHAQHGVRIQTGVQVVSIDRNTSGRHRLAVLAGDGSSHPADVVIVGIGAQPVTALAQEAGLQCDDGIVVDVASRTSDPDIVAAGDCTRHPNALAARSVRLETVHNAVEQAKVAALTVCGKPAVYQQAPWVWSDQYDFRLHAVGFIDGYDEHVVRGDPAAGRFAVCYFRGGGFVGLHAINRPLEFAAARRLLNGNVPLSPADAGRPDFDLAQQAAPRLRLQY